ncbi:MAG: hypothetical protein AAF628_28750 [Planctomycetota bacterium]
MVALVVHGVATTALTGLIWFVQVVHYPLFANVGNREFPAYAEQHVRRTTMVAAPLMLVEAATAAWLTIAPPTPAVAPLTWVGFALLLVIWISTAALQVPCHGRLARGFDPKIAGRLVRTNWVRTIAWTARCALATAMLAVSR